MSATYMRLEKRPVCRLFSPLPERPIQASNNHCSNTAAYLYTFYQKFKPHSKKHRTHPPLFPHPVHPAPPHPNPPRSPHPNPPHTHPNPPRPPPESPAKAGAHAPHPNPPHTPPNPPPPPVSPAKAGAHAARNTASPPESATPPRIAREGGGPRRPQDTPRPPLPLIPAKAGIHPAPQKATPTRATTAETRHAAPSSPRLTRHSGESRNPSCCPPTRHSRERGNLEPGAQPSLVPLNSPPGCHSERSEESKTRCANHVHWRYRRS